MALPRNCKRISLLERVISAERTIPADFTEPIFAIYHNDFISIIGADPEATVALEAKHPFAHEAGVYIPNDESVFVTSNKYLPSGAAKGKIVVSKLSRDSKGNWTRHELSTGVRMGNGGINYKNGILFCDQGSGNRLGGLVYMNTQPPYATTVLLDNYHGRAFNSVNDVVVSADGTIWFTDPIYGYEQGFKGMPQLPCQVYRFDPETSDVRVMADGFGRPNGICFSPDEKTVYITDTDSVHGDGTTDPMRASTMSVTPHTPSDSFSRRANAVRYAFDLVERNQSPFLSNRRLFAMADVGIPDGIKCDLKGNVYSGCGDGVSVWNAGGVLLGKIMIRGGVANFCFGRKGEMFLLNETKFWVVRVAKNVQGALLHGMGIKV
ncbi:hypothetical protein LTR66_013005 [Elasticomyces elasticus]|nr:hypothetical protein LTR66_013005 [Elasticomyces elasticus]KAK4975704.1 hypothetical protein LTR28_008762 [Elasticomyces elasticus]